MPFKTKSVVTEKVEDTNPVVWAQAAEESLRRGENGKALTQIDKAVLHSGGADHYLFEKVRVLYAIGRHIECLGMLSHNLDSWYISFGQEKKRMIAEYCRGLGRYMYLETKSLYDQRRFAECAATVERYLDRHMNVLKFAGGEKAKIRYFGGIANLRSGNIALGINRLVSIPNYKWLIPVAAVAVLCVSGFSDSIYRMYSSNPNNSPTANDKKYVTAASGSADKDTKSRAVAPLTADDASLAGIRLNSDISNAERMLGDPQQMYSGGSGKIYTFRNGIELTVLNNVGKVSAITIDSKSYASGRGIRVGDTAEKVVAAYGQAVIYSYDHYSLYEYFYEASPAYILRFAVDKQSNMVEYIGARLKENGSAETGSKETIPKSVYIAVVNMSGSSNATNRIIAGIGKTGFRVANYGDAVATVRDDTIVAIYTDDPAISDNPKVLDSLKSLPFKYKVEYRRIKDSRTPPAGPIELYIGRDNR